MQILVVVPIIIIAVFVLGELFRKVGLPSVVGQIIAGILFSIPIFKNILFNDESSLLIVGFLAELGIVFLLFLAGLEIDTEKIKEVSKDSILIALSSALLPFLLGFTFIKVFLPTYGFIEALVFGGTLMVTAAGITVKVLMDLDSLNTRLGAVLLVAGAIDDIFAVLFLSIVVVMVHGGSFMELVKIPLELIVFVVIAFVAFKVISKVLHHLDKNGGDETALFSITMIFVLVLAALSESLQIGYLIGAITSGFFLQISIKNISDQHKKDMIKIIKLITLCFILPFFFANVGLNFDLGAVFSNVPLIAATVAIAFIGKFVGTLIVKPVSRLNLKQLYYAGWAMNSRGAAELVVALIAVQQGLIHPEIFSALVAMTLITTLVFPLVLARGISKNPGLMDAESAKHYWP